MVWYVYGLLLHRLTLVRLELAAPTVQSMIVRAGIADEVVLQCIGCATCTVHNALRMLQVHLCGHKLQFLDPRTLAAIDKELERDLLESTSQTLSATEKF